MDVAPSAAAAEQLVRLQDGPVRGPAQVGRTRNEESA